MLRVGKETSNAFIDVYTYIYIYILYIYIYIPDF